MPLQCQRLQQYLCIMHQMKQTITYQDFQTLDIRIGTITHAELVPKSEKLIKLEVDFGSQIGKRQILTGMQSWYVPTDFIGKQMPFIINLEPRKMMGLESQGMVLSVDVGEDGRPIFLFPIEEVENGAGIS